MRKKYGVLMMDGQPIGGQWNYDKQNRQPANNVKQLPPPFVAEIDDNTQHLIDQVIALVETHFADHFGDVLPFYFATTRSQALLALDHFIEERLSQFGDFQDAMIQDEPWMCHSHLSFYLNCGLLLPLECIQRVESAYHQGKAPINAVEGFIRQILGWREFIRGVYWLRMPNYQYDNYLQAHRPLPSFYWSGKTAMNCLKQCVDQTRQNSYAHHIQRLMVLGNFALLAGIQPSQVNEWFLIVYADAYEWVELPNVSGMVLFADGGVVASKPYAAGGAYIKRMSNYCQHCRYSVNTKIGSNACPFNYLYWNFLIENRQHLKGNPRLTMMYKNLERLNPTDLNNITKQSNDFLDKCYTNNEH